MFCPGNISLDNSFNNLLTETYWTTKKRAETTWVLGFRCASHEMFSNPTPSLVWFLFFVCLVFWVSFLAPNIVIVIIRWRRLFKADGWVERTVVFITWQLQDNCVVVFWEKGDVSTQKDMYLNSELDRCCKALNGHRYQTTGPAQVSLHLKAAAHVDAKYPAF